MISQTSIVHSSTPSANESEFNCSKPFLCKGIDVTQQPGISAPLSLLINLSIGDVWMWIASLIIRSGEFVVWSSTEASSHFVGQ